MIGAIIAMQCEADILEDKISEKKINYKSGKKIVTGNAFGKEIVLIVCGIGKVNAAIGAQIALDLYHAKTLINFGVAGGIKENTAITKVYAISKVVQYDFDLAGLNGTKIGTLDEFKENYLPLSILPLSLEQRNLGTGDRFNDDEKDYLLLKNEMLADIRDMEGGAIAQVAIHANTPIYEFKAISDKAKSGSSFEQYKLNRTKSLENLSIYLPEIFTLL